MQQADNELARRFAEVDEQIKDRWQEFQRRCQAEDESRLIESRLLESRLLTKADLSHAGEAAAEAQAELARLTKELQEGQAQMVRREAEVTERAAQPSANARSSNA